MHKNGTKFLIRDLETCRIVDYAAAYRVTAHRVTGALRSAATDGSPTFACFVCRGGHRSIAY